MACSLSDMHHNLVFREAKSGQKDGKVFQRTKEAIRMYYNAKALKNINENKTLMIDDLEKDPEDPLFKTLLARGWKAPKSNYTNREQLPYKP